MAFWYYPFIEEVTKEGILIPYWQEQAYYVLLPIPYEYYLWQPRLKNYYTPSQGYLNSRYANYAWLDQDLRKTMGR